MQPTIDCEKPDFPIFLGLPAIREELPYRLRQQSLLGEFGRAALQTRNVEEILQRAAELCAVGLGARFAKVLEFLPEQKRLVARAGVGWAPDRIANISFATDDSSPAGYAFRTGQAVISNQVQADTRFRSPALLTDHDIKRAINVLIERGGHGNVCFGVLEVDSPDPGRFDQADADFLAAFAGLLGLAIERQQADASLQEALEYQALLTREMSHRVKNSLTSVVGLLRVQSHGAHSEDVRDALEEAGARVATIAQVHDHLWRGSKIGFVDLADFIIEFCGKLQGTAGRHVIRCHADPMLLSADHAIPLGLLINELVSNAVKHAYPDDTGVIVVSAREIEGLLRVEVIDYGIGLPAGFDIGEKRASLGIRVITGLTRQLHGHLTVSASDPCGAHFRFDLPILPVADASIGNTGSTGPAGGQDCPAAPAQTPGSIRHNGEHHAATRPT
jgi:two-component sensor histidine kinase/putative methionine-R-sulfoxide reductase with GAF domain